MSTNIVMNTPYINISGLAFSGDLRRIDDNHFAWSRKRESDGFGIVKIGTVDALGDTTVGVEAVGNNGSPSSTCIIPLTDTLGVYLYTGGTTNVCQIATFDTSTNTVSLDATNYSFSSVNSLDDHVWAHKINDTQFLVIYGNTDLRMKIGTVSGGTLSWGVEFIDSDFVPGTTHMIIDDNNRIWVVSASGTKILTITYNISGTTISGGSLKTTYTSTNLTEANRPHVTYVGTNRALFTWQTDDKDVQLYVLEWVGDGVVLDDKGLVIYSNYSLSGSNLLTYNYQDMVSLTTIKDDEVLFSFTGSSPNYCYVYKIHIDGTVLSKPFPVIVLDTNLGFSYNTVLNTELFEINYGKNYFSSGDTGESDSTSIIVDLDSQVLNITSNNVLFVKNTIVDLDSQVLNITSNNVDISVNALIDVNNLTLDLITNNIDISVNTSVDLNSQVLNITSNGISIGFGVSIKLNNLGLYLIPNKIDFEWCGKSAIADSVINVSGINISKPLTLRVNSSKINKEDKNVSSIL